MNVILPLYNMRGLKALAQLTPLIPPRATFMLVSGNMDKPLDVPWVARAAETLKERHPESTIVAATAGLEHLRTLCAQTSYPVEGVVYIYEPNFSNEPEFAWHFSDTLSHFAAVRELAHARSLRAIGKPTGRPLYQRYLFPYGWDYAALGAEVDELFIQTQTYCKKDPEAFGGALGRLLEQRHSAGQRAPVSVQISVDPASPNGVTAESGKPCLQKAVHLASEGELAGLMLWWSPRYPQELAGCLAELAALRV